MSKVVTMMINVIVTYGSAVGTVHQEDKTIDQVVDVLLEWRTCSAFRSNDICAASRRGTHLERPGLRTVTVDGHVLTLEGPVERQAMRHQC